MKYPNLENDLCHLNNDLALFKEASRELINVNPQICGSCEFFYIGLVRRATAFTDAFIYAIRDDNHFVAPGLIRPNLEHVLILHAAEQYEGNSIHDFTYALLNGQRVTKMKNTQGKTMREATLAKSHTKQINPSGDAHADTAGLYRWSNKFVHFGTIHMFSSLKQIDENGRFQALLWKNSDTSDPSKPKSEIPSVTQHDVRNWIVAMHAINRLIRAEVQKAIEAKRTHGLLCRRIV